MSTRDEQLTEIVTDIAQHCYAVRARRIGRAVTRIYEEEMRSHGVSVAHFNILVAVASVPGLRAADLAPVLDLEKSTLSRNLKRLTSEGLIELHTGEDARAQTLFLTEKGAELLKTAYPDWKRAQLRAQERLGDGALALLNTLSAKP